MFLTLDPKHICYEAIYCCEQELSFIYTSTQVKMKSKAPSNSSVVAWRILLNRVQTKMDLARRNALPPNSGLECGLCLRVEENCSHLFFECCVSWKVWMRICKWLGVTVVLHKDPKEHFLQFCVISGVGSRSSKTMILVWIATVYVLWSCRNNSVFRGEAVDVERIVDLVQFRSWLWLKAKARGFSVSHYEWVSNPNICINLLGE